MCISHNLQPLMLHWRWFWRAAIVAALILALLTTPAPQARSAGGVRFAKPTPAGAGDCSTWENACTLSIALSGAAPGEEIWAASGVYTPTLGVGRSAAFTLTQGVAIYGGFGGVTETLRSQRDWIVHPTTLSGDIGVTGVISDNLNHVVVGSGVTETAVLDGFTITGGSSSGVYNLRGSPCLENLVIRANAASGNGGGMYNDNSHPRLTNVVFVDNRAKFNGGGMCNLNSHPSLTNVVFRNNSAVSGGAMANYWDSDLRLAQVAFTANTATQGGGMYNYNASPSLANVTFNGNFASGNGGGIYNMQASPRLANALFSGNTAILGGGIFNYLSSPGLVNVTFSGNTASYGAGIYNLRSSPGLTNSLLWGNSAFFLGAQLYSKDQSFPSLHYSLVQGGWSGAGEHNLAADPRLVRLPAPGPDGAWGTAGSSGGADDDYGDLHPGPGSPVFDAGDNAALPLDSLDLDADDVLTETLPLDLDGQPRLLSLTQAAPVVDLGAYETSNTPPALSPLSAAQTLEDTPLTIPFAVDDGQTLAADLTVKAASGNPLLVAPSGLALGVSGAGRSLTITPTADLNGFAPITLTVSDGGLTATLDFSLTVIPVNDAPSFTLLSSGDVRVQLEAGPYQADWAGAITPGPANENEQSLAFVLTNDNPFLFSQAPTITLQGGVGVLRFAPLGTGLAHISVELQDSQGGRSPVYPFTITVLPWRVFLPLVQK